ncbi:MAG: hypothetical protein WB919_04925 [Candidatus Sulfotelmatobacter sp.]
MSKTHDEETVLPSVDISSGILSDGPIKVGHEFNFSTTATADNISVTVPTGPNSAWFSTSPAVFNGPGSVTVTAELASIGEGWGFGVTGIDRSNSNPHIPVGSEMQAAKAS